MKKRKGAILVTCGLALLILQACLSENIPLPQRNFTVADLLIDQSQLPAGWVTKDGPGSRSCDSYNFSYCLEASGIVFDGPTKNQEQIEQVIGRFESEDSAANNYNEHGWTSNSDGASPFHWVPMSQFDYVSPIANQFRVVCDTKWAGNYCVIEAQYDEYFTVLFFHGPVEFDLALADVELLAKAMDAKMNQYLNR